MWSAIREFLILLVAWWRDGEVRTQKARADDLDAENAELRQRLQDAEELGRLSGPERDERMRAAEDRVRELQSGAPKRD